jgi:hypothetical protein
MRLTKEWTKSNAVDMESATTVKGSVAVGALAALKAEAERTLTKHYSASVEDRRSFEEEVTLTIGAGVRTLRGHSDGSPFRGGCRCHVAQRQVDASISS